MIRWLVLLGFALTPYPCAFALAPSLDISQYAHTKWMIEDGQLKTRVLAIVQTPDGYLWLGTEDGLVRFDGRFTPWDPPKEDRLPGQYIYRLLVSRDGRLWIATDKGLASWNGTRLAVYPELSGERIVALAEDGDGTLWAGSLKAGGQLCAIHSSKTQCFGGSDRFGLGVDSLYNDNHGNLWVSSQAGLWRWKPGSPTFYRAPTAEEMGQDEQGRLLLATPAGIFRFEGDKPIPYPSPLDSKPIKSVRVLKDRDGNLWIGRTERGLLHFHQGRTDGFSRSDGLSGESITSLYEDREGDIWVATPDGLDRFHAVPVAKLSVGQGLPMDAVFVQAAKDSKIWLGTRNDFYNWDGQRLTVIGKGDGLPAATVSSAYRDHFGQTWISTHDAIYRFEQNRFVLVTGAPKGLVFAIADDNAGSLWISTNQTLSHLLDGATLEQIPWTRLGHQDWAMAMVRDRIHGGIWLGFWKGGVVYFRDGQARESYGQADGLGRGLVSGLEVDNQGALWVSTESGLSRIQDGRIATLTSKDGLPCDSVQWAMEDDDHSYWLYMSCGLVRVARTELDAWIADPKHVLQRTLFDGSDGVRLHSQRLYGSGPQVTKAADGRLWFVSGGGVSMIDPRHIPANKIPPSVYVEEISANHQVRWQSSSGIAPSNLHLPALSRDVEIDYTALSLVAPEKVRFKHKLEGYDRDWQDAGNQHKAFYTNLPPRDYHFCVMAANNDGVWNNAGAVLGFSIDPAWYQTRWFQAACVTAALAILSGLYWYRLRQVAQNFNLRFEERLIERTRIARELHDTLLQSFQGLMLRLQAVNDLLPDGKAKHQLEETLQRGDKAIAEGRVVVYDLRSSTTSANDLTEAVRALGEELRTPDSATFHLEVEGAPRDLNLIIRDEICRIAREALRNAFNHAEARHIEAELTYGERSLRVRVRDDGRGIPAKFLEQGRDGHYGLCGMRERARQIGGNLEIWSRPRAGTEIELSIAGWIAYRTRPVRPLFRLFRRKQADL